MSAQIIQEGKYEPRMLRDGAELHPAQRAEERDRQGNGCIAHRTRHCSRAQGGS